MGTLDDDCKDVKSALYVMLEAAKAPLEKNSLLCQMVLMSSLAATLGCDHCISPSPSQF